MSIQGRRTALTPILGLGISTPSAHVFVIMMYPHTLNIRVTVHRIVWQQQGCEGEGERQAEG